MALPHRRRRSGASRYLTAGALLLATLVAASSAARAVDIQVILDQAKLEKVPDRVVTLVVGNPLIADVSIQAGGVMVVTGRGYGTTNVIALDRAGQVLMERTIEVMGPNRDVVVLYRGAERETLSCTPLCAPRITLGDGNDYFNGAIAQTGVRNAAALGANPTQAATPK